MIDSIKVILITHLPKVIEWILRIFTVLMSYVLGVFYEVRMLFHVIVFLIVLDQVLGVCKAIKLKEFDWQIFKRWVWKFIGYFCVMMATFAFEEHLLYDNAIEAHSHFFTKSVTTLIGFQELVSIYVNATKLTGITLFENIINRFRNAVKVNKDEK